MYAAKTVKVYFQILFAYMDMIWFEIPSFL